MFLKLILIDRNLILDHDQDDDDDDHRQKLLSKLCVGGLYKYKPKKKVENKYPENGRISNRTI
ncbi:hypothetical protein DERP_002843 [Dermatophagoides pteronyssinus]|uniref:Uncharacterized protein n=1 Tax=Dermatophagoides pteronyssinus TaxID=6956 RepID=A0ABQ8JVV1_DERPT|nr:hypothetical protein DERP_002843 [Dermatophagoides pteronyssinus]